MQVRSWFRWLGTPRCQAALLAMASFLAVLVTLGDPGITSDEPLDVSVGRRYLLGADRYLGLYQGLLSGAPSRRDCDFLFRDNAQHPPLGRLLVGLASIVVEPVESFLGGADPFSVHPARVAPAVAFGLLVGLVGLAGNRLGGLVAGWAAGLALMGMPRLFAHGHFATLDTLLCLAWVAALLTAEWSWRRGRTTWRSALAGLVWGLALLIKIHAWLLAPLVVVRLVWKLGWKRGLLATVAWAGAGLTLFLAGWPWLWFDTWERLQAYLSTSVDRLPLRVEYFGKVYLDHNVPWHYPWVYFAVTVPLGLHLLGVLGARVAWLRRGEVDFPVFLLATITGWLVLFSTNAPVYDGERLFLVVFPIWAILIGLGFGRVWNWRGKATRVLLCVVFLLQGYGVMVLHPFGLSYYNLVVGGLPGAERLGLELTYWGDAIDRQLLDGLARRARPRQTAAVAPTLHHLQATSLQTRALVDRSIALQEEGAITSADWLLVYRRTAYWAPGLEAELRRCRPILLQRRQGVWLSGLWLRPGVRFAVQDPSPVPPVVLPVSSSSHVELSGREYTIRSE